MAKTAPTVLDYLESEFATFDEAPMNVLDATALAELAMVRAEGFAPTPCPVRDLLQAEHYPEMFSGFIADSLRRALLALAASPRFRDLLVEDVSGGVDESAQMQFGAVCVRRPGSFAVVAFRGTDGTITGWREDFNMAFTWPVPGQEQARAYLAAMAGRVSEPLYVCGHSKGGNLAAYAAAKASREVRERIMRVWDLDGPGFRPEAFAAGEYDRIAPCLEKVIPRDSVVGLVLERRDDWRVVASGALGIMQHDAFSWEADLAARDFVDAGTPSASALYVRDVVAGWLERYTDEELALFVQTIFSALRRMAGSDNLADVLRTDGSFVSVLAQAARESRGEGRTLAVRMMAELTASAARTAADAVGDAMQAAVDGARASVGDLLPVARTAGDGGERTYGGERTDGGADVQAEG